MIYLIFGEDTASSRNKLSGLLTESQNIIRIDGKKQKLAEIDTFFVSNSLFSEKKNIVVDRFTKVTPQKEFFEKVQSFEKNPDTNIFLWEASDLTPKVKSAFKTAKVFSFAFPKFYYEFLDEYKPNVSSVKIFHQVLKTFEAEQALYGLIRRIRQLIIIKGGNASASSEFKSVQSWQLSKLERQANFWSEKQLGDAFLELTELDEKMKTGALTMSLQAHIDILLSRA